jgi:indolepyruvate ferredoxin oxidoreductase
VLVANQQEDIRTTRVSMASADLIIGCDPIVSASKETTLRMREGRTHVALNSNSTPTAAFVKNGNWQNPAEACVAAITAQVGVQGVSSFDADTLAKQLMGDTIYVNPMILGFAWQKGWVPLRRESLLRAIELNDVQVSNNLAAFEWGRHAAHQLAVLMQRLQPAQVIQFKKRDSLEDLINDRVRRLTDYQNAAYAARYRSFVLRVQQAEAPLGKTVLSETVARHLYRLMAYKDEYEVARLHTQSDFLTRIHNSFEGDFKVHYHLAPPLLAKRNAKGEGIKQKFGPSMLLVFKLLARLKGLRGTAWDILGRTEERRTERALIDEYQQHITACINTLSNDSHAHALRVAQVPENIKGFGHVKERNIQAARTLWQSLQKG